MSALKQSWIDVSMYQIVDLNHHVSRYWLIRLFYELLQNEHLLRGKRFRYCDSIRDWCRLILYWLFYADDEEYVLLVNLWSGQNYRSSILHMNIMLHVQIWILQIGCHVRNLGWRHHKTNALVIFFLPNHQGYYCSQSRFLRAPRFLLVAAWRSSHSHPLGRPAEFLRNSFSAVWFPTFPFFHLALKTSRVDLILVFSATKHRRTRVSQLSLRRHN